MPLNPFSARVRDMIAAELPELTPYFTETPSGAFAMRLPHARIESGLRVTTEGNEVSVGFRAWHTHGELLGGSTPEAQIAAAIALVRDIVTGRALLALSFVDDRFADAWVTDRPDAESRYVQPNERLEVGTWLGLAS